MKQTTQFSPLIFQEQKFRKKPYPVHLGKSILARVPETRTVLSQHTCLLNPGLDPAQDRRGLHQLLKEKVHFFI